MGLREIYEFGAFTLDPAGRRLSEGSRGVALAPKAFDVLVVLVRHAGRLVTKHELLEAVWREAFVEEGILSVYISGLRKALGEGGRKYIETVSRSGYRFATAVTRMGGASGYPCVAVLPARPITTELLSERDRYMGLTLADVLIDRLGKLRGIIVRPTRAIQQQLNTGNDPVLIGRSLNVDLVVDSHFLRVGERLRVSVHLVGARAGSHLWSGEFEELADDFATLAESISQSLTNFLDLDSGEAGLPLKGKLRVKTPRVPRPACRPEVYEMFGRGRAHLLASSMFELPDAITELQAATALDPTYAAGHAALALAYCAQAEFRMAPPLEAYGAAKASGLRALAMDNLCADAQVALGVVLLLSEWDWAGAKRALERALDLNPNHTEAYLQYGRLLEVLGQLEEGLEFKLRAMERDPFSPLVHLQISLSYWNQRRYDDAIQWARKTLDFDPRHPHAREHLAAAYLKKGDDERYMAENIKHAEMHGAPAAVLDELKQAYAKGGRAAVVRYALDHAPKDDQGANALMMAALSGEAGELNNAFGYLAKALKRHDPGLVYLAVGPQWDSLRGDRRFDLCLARMGLPRLPLN